MVVHNISYFKKWFRIQMLAKIFKTLKYFWNKPSSTELLMEELVLQKRHSE